MSGQNAWDDWLRPDDYRACWEVNTLGVIRVTHAFKPLVKKARCVRARHGERSAHAPPPSRSCSGRIVNMASVCGRVAMPGIGPYTVSKYGVEVIKCNEHVLATRIVRWAKNREIGNSRLCIVLGWAISARLP